MDTPGHPQAGHGAGRAAQRHGHGRAGRHRRGVPGARRHAALRPGRPVRRRPAAAGADRGRGEQDRPGLAGDQVVAQLARGRSARGLGLLPGLGRDGRRRARRCSSTCSPDCPRARRTSRRTSSRDVPEAFWVAELVREQLLAATHDELPYSIATRVTEWEWPRIRVEILVERESQKGMVIGKGGVGAEGRRAPRRGRSCPRARTSSCTSRSTRTGSAAPIGSHDWATDVTAPATRPANRHETVTNASRDAHRTAKGWVLPPSTIGRDADVEAPGRAKEAFRCRISCLEISGAGEAITLEPIGCVDRQGAQTILEAVDSVQRRPPHAAARDPHRPDHRLHLRRGRAAGPQRPPRPRPGRLEGTSCQTGARCPGRAPAAACAWEALGGASDQAMEGAMRAA